MFRSFAWRNPVEWQFTVFSMMLISIVDNKTAGHRLLEIKKFKEFRKIQPLVTLASNHLLLLPVTLCSDIVIRNRRSSFRFLRLWFWQVFRIFLPTNMCAHHLPSGRNANIAIHLYYNAQKFEMKVRVENCGVRSCWWMTGRHEL